MIADLLERRLLLFLRSNPGYDLRFKIEGPRGDIRVTMITSRGTERCINVALEDIAMKVEGDSALAQAIGELESCILRHK